LRTRWPGERVLPGARHIWRVTRLDQIADTLWAGTNARADLLGPARARVRGSGDSAAIAVVLISNGTSGGSETQLNPRAGASSVGSPKTSMRPAKLQAKGLDEAMVPESGPGTYQAAKQAIHPTTLHGTLIRYDARVEDGLS
jgi:hypothetical protein